MTNPKKQETLPAPLVFRADGHLENAAIAALVDAQLILPDEAYAHVTECDACSDRVGVGALASAATHVALERVQAAAQALPLRAGRAQTAHRPMPVLAVAAAIVLAAAGVAPLVLDLPRWLPHAAVAAVRLSPAVVRGALVAVHHASSACGLATFGAAMAVAVVALFAVSRLVLKTGSSGVVSNEGVSS